MKSHLGYKALDWSQSGIHYFAEHLNPHLHYSTQTDLCGLSVEHWAWGWGQVQRSHWRSPQTMGRHGNKPPPILLVSLLGPQAENLVNAPHWAWVSRVRLHSKPYCTDTIPSRNGFPIGCEFRTSSAILKALHKRSAKAVPRFSGTKKDTAAKEQQLSSSSWRWMSG